MELKELWKKASESERTAIDAEVSLLLESMDESDVSSLEEAVSSDFKRMHEEAADIEKTLSLRKKLEPVLPFINIAEFSRHYFGKSSSWFYQRLNGNIVHGKPAAFTEEEKKIFIQALQDMCVRISDSITSIN